MHDAEQLMNEDKLLKTCYNQASNHPFIDQCLSQASERSGTMSGEM